MTQQISEIVFYEDKKHFIKEYPLKKYIEKKYGDHRVRNNGFVSSACWRGYVGTWKIENNKLFLIDISMQKMNETYSNIDYFFPGETKVFADWFSGEIGIVTNSVKDKRKTHEDTLFLNFVNGILKDKSSRWVESYSPYLSSYDEEEKGEAEGYLEYLQRKLQQRIIENRKEIQLMIDLEGVIIDDNNDSDEITPVSNAIEYVKKLMDYFDVYIITDMGTRNKVSFTKKTNWLKSRFSNNILEKVIFTNNKNTVNGNYYILSEKTKPEINFDRIKKFKVFFYSDENNSWDNIITFLCNKEYCDDEEKQKLITNKEDKS